MATPKKDPREYIQARADAAIRKGVKALEDAIDTEKWQACQKCGNRVYFKDVRAISEAIKLFMDYGFGKPEVRKPQKEDKPLEEKKLEDMTDEELLALIKEDHGKADSSAA